MYQLKQAIILAHIEGFNRIFKEGPTSKFTQSYLLKDSFCVFKDFCKIDWFWRLEMFLLLTGSCPLLLNLSGRGGWWVGEKVRRNHNLGFAHSDVGPTLYWGTGHHFVWCLCQTLQLHNPSPSSKREGTLILPPHQFGLPWQSHWRVVCPNTRSYIWPKLDAFGR